MSTYLRFLAVASVAIIGCSFGVPSVNALATDGHAARRHVAAHNEIAHSKKRRTNSNKKRCMPRGAPQNSPQGGDSNGGDSNTSTTTTTSDQSQPTDNGTTTTTSDQSQPTDDGGDNGGGNNGGGSTDNGGGSTTNGGGSTNNGGGSTNNGGGSTNNGGGSTGGSYTPSGGLYNGRKFGLSWPNGGDGLSQYAVGNTWMYNWDSSPGLDLSQFPNVQYLSQLWGCDSDRIAKFQSNIAQGFTKTVLAFNEPNEPGQSNMDAGTMAWCWQQYISPLKAQGYTIGSPVTSSNPNGLTLVQDMVKQCNGNCEWDFTTVHWYDVDIEAFKTYCTTWYQAFGKPVMVTEYACQNFNGGAQCSQDETWAFHQAAAAWMDSQDWIIGYAPFSPIRDLQGVNTDNAIMDPNSGNPTALGSWYINSS